METVRTSIRIPEHLYKMIKDNGLCLTDMVVEMLEERARQIQNGDPDTPPTPDQRIETALEKLVCDPDLIQYLTSAKRVHRKVVAYANWRIELEVGFILNTRQREKVRDFLVSQLQVVMEEVETRPPPIDKITGERLRNYMANRGYLSRLLVEGKTPELLHEIGEKFIRASGPVTPTTIESIIDHIETSF